MSIPNNHHYVSQCHIKNFFNKTEKNIYLYDKKINNFYAKNSVKRIFSEEYANSRFINNSVDDSGLEKELSNYFEMNFLDNCRAIERFVEDHSFDVSESLINLTKFGIISIVRHPIFKKRTDNTIHTIFKDKIYPNSSPEFAKELEDLFSLFDKTKFTNKVGYKEIADEIFSSMKFINFIIIKIENDDNFILADNYAIIKRTLYASNSLARVITGVGLPLGSKLFLSVDSENIKESSIKIMKVTDNKNNRIVEMINTDLYKRAIKTIACEDQKYLQNFIEKLSKP